MRTRPRRALCGCDWIRRAQTPPRWRRRPARSACACAHACVRVRVRVCARARRWWFCSRIRSNLVGMGNMNRKDFLQRAQVHSEGPCQAFVPPTGDRGGTLGMHRPAGATGGAPGHPHSASGAAGPGQSCPRSEGACSGLAGASQRLCVLSDPVLGAVSSRRGHRLLMLKQVL